MQKEAIQPITKEEVKEAFSMGQVNKISTKIEEKSEGGFCQFFWVDYESISVDSYVLDKVDALGLKVIGIYPQKKGLSRLVLEKENLETCIGVQTQGDDLLV